MNVPILLHHLRDASGIVVRVQTDVEFLHTMTRRGKCLQGIWTNTQERGSNGDVESSVVATFRVARFT